MESFEDIYNKYYPMVYGYLMSLTHSQDLAEEMTQETFYKALKNIDKYDSSQKMLTWLCTIGKNTYFSYYKKQAKQQELDENKEEVSADILECLIDSQMYSELLKIVHQLEEPYKEVFTLRTFGELSFRQIAEVFEKTESWARVTYYRGKSKIKEKLDYDKM